MPTLEERLAALEHKYGALDGTLQGIRRSLEILTNVGTKQQLTNTEMAENMTILLGIAAAHQREIAEIKTRLGSIEQRLVSMETGFDIKLDAILAMLGKQ